MSTENGVYPPTWYAHSRPFTKTFAVWSTAPKCRSTLFPRKLSGNVKRFLYQRYSSLLRLRPTPESSVSGENGTMISPSKLFGMTGELHMAYSQRPFRFIHSARTICGLGYSFSG